MRLNIFLTDADEENSHVFRSIGDSHDPRELRIELFVLSRTNLLFPVFSAGGVGGGKGIPLRAPDYFLYGSSL